MPHLYLDVGQWNMPPTNEIMASLVLRGFLREFQGNNSVTVMFSLLNFSMDLIGAVFTSHEKWGKPREISGVITWV